MTLTRRRLMASSPIAAGTLPLNQLGHGEAGHCIALVHGSKPTRSKSRWTAVR